MAERSLAGALRASPPIGSPSTASPMAERSLAGALRASLAEGRLELAPPGRGRTPERLRALFALGREDLALARLAEAHVDAVAILAEAERSPVEGALYGVWASEGGGVRLQLEGGALSGAKRFCTGAGLLDRALVLAETPEGPALVEVDLSGPRVGVDASDWASPAFAATSTATVRFEGAPVATEVGPPRWYAERPGFWMGAVGPAACWAGGAAGLVDAAWATPREAPHPAAQLGALAASAWGFAALLEEAGRQIDAAPGASAEDHQARALSVRQLVERMCTDVLDRFGRATGPRLLAFDPDVARRHAELTLYIRQCHAEADLETLARLSLPKR